MIMSECLTNPDAAEVIIVTPTQEATLAKFTVTEIVIAILLLVIEGTKITTPINAMITSTAIPIPFKVSWLN